MGAELREQVRSLKEIGTQNRERYDAAANVAQDYGDVARAVLEELHRTGFKSDIDYLRTTTEQHAEALKDFVDVQRDLRQRITDLHLRTAYATVDGDSQD